MPGAGSEPAAKARAASADHSALSMPGVSLRRSTNSSPLSRLGAIMSVPAAQTRPVGFLEDDVDAVEKALDRIGMQREGMAGAGPADDGFGHGRSVSSVGAGRNDSTSFGSSQRLATSIHGPILSRKSGSFERAVKV